VDGCAVSLAEADTALGAVDLGVFCCAHRVDVASMRIVDASPAAPTRRGLHDAVAQKVTT
jgi:hypothetical protein